MRIYLAGPMTGIPYFNYPAFDAEAKRLRELGHEVFNPADHDTELFGADISNPTGSAEQAAREYGFDRRKALKDDTSWICDNADAIVLLPGWEKSSGARAECALAEALGLRVFGPGLGELVEANIGFAVTQFIGQYKMLSAAFSKGDRVRDPDGDECEVLGCYPESGDTFVRYDDPRYGVVGPHSWERFTLVGVDKDA